MVWAKHVLLVLQKFENLPALLADRLVRYPVYQYPGTQVKQTRCDSDSAVKASLHSHTNLEVIFGLCRAFIAAWLSEQI